jgi:hypothetical protein
MCAKLREIKEQLMAIRHEGTERQGRWLRQGLLCGADERLGNLSIPVSHDRTLARRTDASKPKTSTYVDENEEDRRPVPAIPAHPAPVA